MNVILFNMGTGNRSSVSVNTGATIADVFEAGEITVTTGVELYLNRQPASMASSVDSGDEIRYSTTDVKGASEDEAADSVDELRQLTYEDVVNAGQREMPTGDALWAKIFAKKLKTAQESVEVVGGEVFDLLEGSMASSNKRLANLKKQLAAAEDENSRLRYATKQFTQTGNIASPLSAMGMKASAPAYFDRIGVPVPAKNSDVWHTSDSDGKTEA